MTLTVIGWLLIAVMVIAFALIDRTMFKAIKNKNAYSFKVCYVAFVVKHSITCWFALLSLMCMFSALLETNGLTVSTFESVMGSIYGLLLIGIPIIQFLLISIGTIKYTTSVLKKSWLYPFSAIGIAMAIFCLIFAIISAFL